MQILLLLLAAVSSAAHHGTSCVSAVVSNLAALTLQVLSLSTANVFSWSVVSTYMTVLLQR
jgi:hypothetical protein